MYIIHGGYTRCCRRGELPSLFSGRRAKSFTPETRPAAAGGRGERREGRGGKARKSSLACTPIPSVVVMATPSVAGAHCRPYLPLSTRAVPFVHPLRGDRSPFSVSLVLSSPNPLHPLEKFDAVSHRV